MKTFVVIAAVEVEAEDDDAAMKKTGDVLKRGWRRGEGVGLVADFITTDAPFSTVRKLLNEGGTVRRKS